MRAVSGAAEGGSLDTLANNSSAPGQRLADPDLTPAQRRYLRRSWLWKESGLDRVRDCGWKTVSGDGRVTVRARAQVTGFAGLASCGSVWACPVCNAKIAARRSLEVGVLLAAAVSAGMGLALETLTTRHRLGQALAPMWAAQSYAWQSTNLGRAGAREREQYGLVGWVRAAEVTWGRNGFHPHLHSVQITQKKIGLGALYDLHAARVTRWSNALERRGFQPPLSLGQDIKLVRSASDIAEYISKLADSGHVLRSSGTDTIQARSADRGGPADLGRELTHSQGKVARRAYSTRPVLSLIEDFIVDGDADALSRWHEYERATKGKRQLTYSQRIRQLLKVQIDLVTDEEITAEEVGTKADDLVHITADGWARVVGRPILQPKILEVARLGQRVLADFLQANRVEFDLVVNA